ncbi:response regulator transcription factor [Lederbergia citri]|uniref:Response regulator n=1 Tax=Lederbergia citri TaxID=2833580 RepID=A0A942YIM4_9BACI|nr:response regulator [Lederbergia citri]MBS4197762.1 response regulator [Lederbergia citri]
MKRILLAEDEEVLRMLVVDTLEDQDYYTVDEAIDGGEAWDLIQSNHYDLIILDYMMPIYTGLEIIEKIRNVENKNEYTKILMLSAKSQMYEQERILQAGADYFMAKPFSPMELLGLVVGILHENS